MLGLLNYSSCGGYRILNYWLDSKVKQNYKNLVMNKLNAAKPLSEQSQSLKD